MFHAILVLVFFCNYLLLLMFHLDWWHMAERWASRCNTQETCQMKSDVWQGTDPNDVSTWEQVRCVAVWIFWGASKMLCCFKRFGEDCMNWKQNWKRGIFSVHVLFVQTSTQYYNTNIQNWIKIATLLYVFVFLNSLRVIWMFTFCLDNLDNLCKLCNSTLHYSPHASAWSLSTHHPIISTSWSWKLTYQ